MLYDTDAIRRDNDLFAIAASYGKLVRAGTELKGCCMVHGGDNPGAFNVYTKDGVQRWVCHTRHCEQEGDASNDVIGFIMAVERLDFKAACELLNGKKVSDWKPSISNPPRPPKQDRVTCKPPKGTPAPSFKLKHLGEPVKVWTYKDTDGEVLGYVARYETETGKEIRCWTYSANDLPNGKWGVGAFTKLRPLYRLDALSSRPADKVCIVEGEKTCDAANEILPEGYVAVTWPGGAGAWKHADFEPLRGRSILLWPDADEPGREAMRVLGMVLRDKKGLACE